MKIYVPSPLRRFIREDLAVGVAIDLGDRDDGSFNIRPAFMSLGALYDMQRRYPSRLDYLAMGDEIQEPPVTP